MKVLIIDDEPLARQELVRLLRSYPSVEIVGQAGSIAQAAPMIRDLRPELLFLDIRMPGENGLEYAEQVSHLEMKIIFTTAYSEYAVRAFECNALDYLLKPIETKRLAKAMAKCLESAVDSASNEAAPKGPLDVDDQVFIKHEGNFCFITVREIYLLESEGNYTRIYFKDQKPLLFGSLTALEERLPKHLFFRANRSQVINLSYIKTIEPWFSDCLKIALQPGVTVELSRRQSQLFESRTSLR